MADSETRDRRRRRLTLCSLVRKLVIGDNNSVGDLNDFTRFLENHVNIGRERLLELDTRVERLRTALWRHDGFRDKDPQFVPQGSWAQQTIIAPSPGREFDADLLVCWRPEARWRERPREYLHALHAVVAETVRDRYPIRMKTRCVEISFGDHHVDLVPYVVRPRAELWPRGYIVNRHENQFERVNPEGFTHWFLDQDSTAAGHLRPVTRLLKFARNREAGLEVPSVILTILLGQQVHRGVAASGGYQDVPTALRSLVGGLDRWLAARPTMPRIADPSCWGAGFEHRLDPQSYQGLRRWVAECAVTVEAAAASGNRPEQVRCWRRFFGDSFGE